RPQALNVDQLETCPPRKTDRILDRDQLTVGKHIAAHETRVPEPEPPCPDAARSRGGRDAVVEEQPVWLQRLQRSSEILRQTGPANMLEHPDRCDGVELA